MIIDFSKEQLPRSYVRKGRKCYLDPIREKLIFITPEETVRQQVVAYIINKLSVPANMIDVEVHLAHYNIKSKKRADIVINKYDAEKDMVYPLCVIECKAPGIMLGENVQKQMMGYCDAFNCDYGMITNGYDVQCFHYNMKINQYEFIESIPDYFSMIKGEFVVAPEYDIPERLAYGELEQNWKAYIGTEMGENLKKEYAVPMVNLWECLLYDEHTLPKKRYKLFDVIDDLGIRILSYGNASGGVFQGPYRSFILKYKNSTEIVSIGFSKYVTYAKPDITKTAILVAIDNEEESHHALQYVVDDNLYIKDNAVMFYHHGRIGIGNKGSGKIDELRQFINEFYPEIVDGKRFNLGKLKNDHLWNLDEQDVMDFMENLISYALIRDEYRTYVKNNKDGNNK